MLPSCHTTLLLPCAFYVFLDGEATGDRGQRRSGGRVRGCSRFGFGTKPNISYHSANRYSSPSLAPDLELVLHLS